MIKWRRCQKWRRKTKKNEKSMPRGVEPEFIATTRRFLACRRSQNEKRIKKRNGEEAKKKTNISHQQACFATNYEFSINFFFCCFIFKRICHARLPLSRCHCSLSDSRTYLREILVHKLHRASRPLSTSSFSLCTLNPLPSLTLDVYLFPLFPLTSEIFGMKIFFTATPDC